MSDSSDITFQPVGADALDEKRLGRLLRISQVDTRLSRTAYFDGRLLTARDLLRDHIYLDNRLLEIGRSEGGGVVEGLETRLEGSRLIVAPGLGVTRVGRALSVEAEGLEADLGDRGQLQALNDELPRQLSTGLYALVLLHGEIGVGAAEVFPRDLGAERRAKVDSLADAVQLALVPLPIPLPHGDGLAARALLARTLTAGRRLESLLPDDSLALGVLGVRQDLPVWFDQELLRHPRRPGTPPGSDQADLARHYEALFADVEAERRASGLATAWAAGEHFHLLPPAGAAPKLCFDPVRGTQSFFPEEVEVQIAPVRADERETLMRESLLLDPLDLESGAPASVMVLATLPPEDFAALGQALVHGPIPDFKAIARSQRFAGRLRVSGIEPLRLRLFPRPPVHRLDTDADTWRAIWDRIGPEDLFYVRQPHNASATGVSAVVLASGFGSPDTGEVEDPGDDEALEKLKQELAEAKKARQASERARKKAETEAKNATTQAEALEKQVKAGQTELVQAEKLRQTLEVKLRDCERRGGDIDLDRNKLLDQIRDLEQGNLRLKGERDQLVAERGQAVKELQDSLNSRSAEIVDLKKRLKQREDENRRLAVALERATKDGDRFRDRLKAREAELVEVNAALKARDQQIKARDQKIVGFDQQLKAKDRQIATKTQQVKDRDVKLKAANDQVKARDQQIKQLDTQTKAQVLEIQKRDQQIAAKNRQIATKDRQIKTRNDQIKAQKDQIKARDLQLTQLRGRGGTTIRRPR